MNSYCDKIANRVEKISAIIDIANCINLFSRPHPFVSYHYISLDRKFVIELYTDNAIFPEWSYLVQFDDKNCMRSLSAIHKRLSKIYINL